MKHVIASMATLLVATTAFAHDHSGVHVRAAGGVGLTVADFDGGSADAAGPTFSLDIGHSLVDGLVLHGRVSGHNLVDPTYTLSGLDFPATADTLLMNYGLGITKYFGASYVGVAGGVATMDTVHVDVSDPGFFAHFDIGHDFFVAESCAFGFGARALFSQISQDGTDTTFWGVHGLVSVSYH